MVTTPRIGLLSVGNEWKIKVGTGDWMKFSFTCNKSRCLINSHYGKRKLFVEQGKGQW